MDTNMMVRDIASEASAAMFEGGAGSGNYGHKGRPGHRGGSLGGGGKGTSAHAGNYSVKGVGDAVKAYALTADGKKYGSPTYVGKRAGSDVFDFKTTFAAQAFGGHMASQMFPVTVHAGKSYSKSVGLPVPKESHGISVAPRRKAAPGGAVSKPAETFKAWKAKPANSVAGLSGAIKSYEKQGTSRANMTQYSSDDKWVNSHVVAFEKARTSALSISKKEGPNSVRGVAAMLYAKDMQDRATNAIENRVTPKEEEGFHKFSEKNLGKYYDKARKIAKK